MSDAPTQDDPWLSLRSVANLFDVKPDTIRQWIQDGKIEAFKFNNRWRIRKSEVKRVSEREYGNG